MNLPNAFFAAIRLSEELPPEQVERLNELLDQIQLDFNAEIIRPRDRYAEAMERWHNRVLDHMRKGARRIVREMKQRVKKQGRKWTFTWDETDIDGDADEQRIRNVLDFTGRGDEFDKLREQAYSEVEQPTPPVRAGSAEELQRGLNEVAAQIRKRRVSRKANRMKYKSFK